MSEIHDLFPFLPDWVTEEMVERVLSRYEDGAFTFDLDNTEICDYSGNTVYHLIPRYAGDGAEDIVHKLRRIMANSSDNSDV